jgi:hypothetical protein
MPYLLRRVPHAPESSRRCPGSPSASPSSLALTPRFYSRHARAQSAAAPAELPAIAYALPPRRLCLGQPYHRILQFVPPPLTLSGSAANRCCSSPVEQLSSIRADKRPALHATLLAKSSLANPPQHRHRPPASLAHHLPASLCRRSSVPPCHVASAPGSYVAGPPRATSGQAVGT